MSNREKKNVTLNENRKKQKGCVSSRCGQAGCDRGCLSVCPGVKRLATRISSRPLTRCDGHAVVVFNNGCRRPLQRTATALALLAAAAAAVHVLAGNSGAARTVTRLAR